MRIITNPDPGRTSAGYLRFGGNYGYKYPTNRDYNIIGNPLAGMPLDKRDRGAVLYQLKWVHRRMCYVHTQIACPECDQLFWLTVLFNEFDKYWKFTKHNFTRPYPKFEEFKVES